MASCPLLRERPARCRDAGPPRILARDEARRIPRESIAPVGCLGLGASADDRLASGGDRRWMAAARFAGPLGGDDQELLRAVVLGVQGAELGPLTGPVGSDDSEGGGTRAAGGRDPLLRV